MSEIIQFGTFQVFFPGGTCRLAPPYPASRRRLRPRDTGNVSIQFDASGMAPVDSVLPSKTFVEAIGQGYIIPAPFSFQIDMVRDEDGEPRFPQGLPKDIPLDQHEHWAPFPDGHTLKQVVGSPWEDAPWIIKLRGYWYIETPPGYSCLFLSPQHFTREKLPFYALPGMIETDVYKNLISFPMIPQIEFPAVVEEGTPLVQVIPIKRSDWQAEVVCE